MGFAIKKLSASDKDAVERLCVSVYKDTYQMSDTMLASQKEQMILGNIEPVLLPMLQQGNCIGCFSDSQLVGTILAFDFYKMNNDNHDVIKNLFTGFAFKPVEISKLGRQVVFIHSGFVDESVRGKQIFKNMMKYLTHVQPNKVIVGYTIDKVTGRIVERLGFNGVSERNNIKLFQFNTDPVKRAGLHSQQQDEIEAHGGHIGNDSGIISSSDESDDDSDDSEGTKKSSKGIKIAIGIVILLLAAIVGVLVYRKTHNNKPIVQIGNPNKATQQSLESALHSYNATTIDKIVGKEEGDSYLAQEWAWVNNNALRQAYIKKLCSLVKFDYSLGDKNVTATIPDFNSMTTVVKDDQNKRLISMLMESSGYKDTDYDWTYELADLMCQWVCQLDEIPTTTVTIALSVSNGVITDDSALDDAIFGSDEFHKFEDAFGQVAINWKGTKKEVYFDEEMLDNPEYAKWKERFEHYYFADGGYYDEKLQRYRGGHFSKTYSKWEPWFEYQKKGGKKVAKRYKNGDLKVRYYSVKDENGNDWIQPAKQTLQKVKKTRMVDDVWEPEHVLLYNVFGTHYIQTSYKGKGYKTVQVGDGTIKHPAGIGTWIITKALCTDGKYHDVRVAVIGYWLDADAIDYLEQIDERNVGHTTQSAVKYITYEVRVENLEDDSITLPTTEMCLADKNANTQGKSGYEYGFTTNVTIKAHEIVTMNDWNSSTEIEQYYVCWGKDFQRNYPFVYFKILAGTGEVPKYSSYEQFTGDSSMFNSDGTRVDDPYADNSGTQDDGNTTRSVVDMSSDGSTTQNDLSKIGGKLESGLDSISGSSANSDSSADTSKIGGTSADNSGTGGTTNNDSETSSANTNLGNSSSSMGTSSTQGTGSSDTSTGTSSTQGDTSTDSDTNTQ